MTTHVNGQSSPTEVEVNDCAFQLFVTIHLALGENLKAHLQQDATAVSESTISKSAPIDSVATNSNVVQLVNAVSRH